MAEIVQRHVENMVRELEDLRQTKLFSEDMIRRIVVARKHMEAKIYVNFSRNVDDYKNYIQHEMLILEKVRKCRDKKKISEKKSSVDYSIIRRIRRLYELALQKMPSEYSLHIGFFKFCKDHSMNATASQTILNMIKQFAYQPEVWKLAADWYFHINDMVKAVQMYQKGLTFNPQSTLLYTAAIEFELAQIIKAGTSEENKDKTEKHIKKITTYVELILKEMENLELIFRILQILEKQECTYFVQKRILEFLYQSHRHDDSIWHIFAKRELNGMHFETGEENEQISISVNEPLLKNALLKYKQGLQHVSLSGKKQLWSHCIETLLELKNKNISTEVDECLKTSLQEAHANRVLEERYYSIWISMMSEKEGSQILSEATQRYSQSEGLWKLRLRNAITMNKIKEANTVFVAGITELNEKALSLWLMMLKFHLMVSDNELMVGLFEDGISEPPEISNVLKPKYIQWIALSEGMQAAREKYRLIAEDLPHCKELHLTMSLLESSEMTIDKDSWGRVHELACKQFGKTDADVLIEYIKFLLLVKPNDFNQISKVRSEAKQNLPEAIWQEFNEAYEKLVAK